jgi:hypothetical protein
MLQPLPLPLPRRITYGSPVGTSHGTEDGLGPKTFRGACEHAARILRGKLVEWHDSGESFGETLWRLSYREATLVYDFGRTRVRALCNSAVICFTTAESSRSPEKMTFIDCPMLETAIGEKLDGWVLRASDANRQPAPPLTDALEAQEVLAINYHKPQRIGELLFNDWD